MAAALATERISQKWWDECLSMSKLTTTIWQMASQKSGRGGRVDVSTRRVSLNWMTEFKDYFWVVWHKQWLDDWMVFAKMKLKGHAHVWFTVEDHQSKLGQPPPLIRKIMSLFIPLVLNKWLFQINIVSIHLQFDLYILLHRLIYPSVLVGSSHRVTKLLEKSSPVYTQKKEKIPLFSSNPTSTEVSD